ncbi:MAG: glycoside hydrolase family 3 protein, partial [Steroidobacteraceae bacterium]
MTRLRTGLQRLACLAVLSSSVAAAGGSPEAPVVVHPLQWPATTRTAPLDPGTEQFVDQLLTQMSTEEKVGQLVQADIASIHPEDLHQFKLGSILAGGNAAPGNDIHSPPARWLDLADAYYRASMTDPPASHPAIPELFGIDAVHGDSRIPGATVFPQNVGLGAANDPALIEQIGQVTAEEISATGLDWTFAPTVAVVRDVRWGRSYESYSEDPALVARYARAMIAGLQGELGTSQYLAPVRTLATVKHFLGDGGTIDGRDQFDNLSDERTLRDVNGAGYPAAIEAGALTVMASYNSWHGVKMHDNRALLTDVLKGRWQFPGFVVGDWNAQEELPGCTKFDCPDMLLAGVDMYMAPDSWRGLYQHTLAEVKSGVIPMARLDDAVARILRVK